MTTPAGTLDYASSPPPQAMAGRECTECGKPLSVYNHQLVCGPCQRDAR